MAFSIGATTLLPALQAYCLYAAFGVLFVFILNITFFAACVVIDHQRANANRADCCCCITLKEPHPMYPELMVKPKFGSGISAENEKGDDSNSGASVTPTGAAGSSETEDDGDSRRLPYCGCCHHIPAEASRKLFRWIGQQMEKLYVKVGILMVATGMLAFSIYGASQLEQDFKIQWFIPDDSYLQVCVSRECHLEGVMFVSYLVSGFVVFLVS